MQIFHSRPLALAICFFAIAALYANGLTGAGKLIAAGMCLLGAILLTLLLRKRRRLGRRASAALLSLFAVATALLQSYALFEGSIAAYDQAAASDVIVEGYVIRREPNTSHAASFDVLLEEMEGKRTDVKVRLNFSYKSSLQRGDRFRLTGIASSCRDNAYLIADGIRGILLCESPDSCTVLEEKERGFLLTAARLQARLSSRLSGAVGREEGDLASALLLGDKSELDGDTQLSFRRAGISHLLALSGLHVSVLIGLLEFFLRRLRLGKLPRSMVVLISAFFYLFLTGCSMSTVRSVIMVFVLYLGFLFGEAYDSFTALCFALLCILVTMPHAVMDMGMWMSFAATAGIVIFLPAVDQLLEARFLRALPYRLWRLLRAFTVAVVVGLFANAAVLLISARLFGSTSLFSVFVTLLLSPLLPITLLSALLSLCFPSMAAVTGGCRLLMRLMRRVADFFAEIPDGTVLLRGSVTRALLALLGITLVLCAILRLKRKGWMLTPILLSVAVSLSGYAEPLLDANGTVVTFLSTEYDESILLSRGKCAVVIDISSGSEYFASLTADTLEETGCTELEELTFTHYHSRMTSMLAGYASLIKVRTVRLPTPQNNAEMAIAKRLTQEAELHGMRVLTGGETLPLPECEILLLERTDSNGGEVPVFLMLRIHKELLTYCSADAFGTSLDSLVLNGLAAGNTVLIGCHGAEALSAPIPYERLRSDCRLLFGAFRLSEEGSVPLHKSVFTVS